MFDWSQFKIRQFIRTDALNAYGYFSTAKGIAAWFRDTCEVAGRQEEESFQTDDVLELTEAGDPSTCKITNVVKGKLVSFDFEGTQVKVSIGIEEIPGGCVITLHQSNMPTSESDKTAWHLSCRLGWQYFLNNLKSVIEYGNDLREMDLRYKYQDGVSEYPWSND